VIVFDLFSEITLDPPQIFDIFSWEIGCNEGPHAPTSSTTADDCFMAMERNVYPNGWTTRNLATKMPFNPMSTGYMQI
jgi:hypothetical protein